MRYYNIFIRSLAYLNHVNDNAKLVHRRLRQNEYKCNNNALTVIHYIH